MIFIVLFIIILIVAFLLVISGTIYDEKDDDNFSNNSYNPNNKKTKENNYSSKKNPLDCISNGLDIINNGLNSIINELDNINNNLKVNLENDKKTSQIRNQNHTIQTIIELIQSIEKFNLRNKSSFNIDGLIQEINNINNNEIKKLLQTEKIKKQDNELIKEIIEIAKERIELLIKLSKITNNKICFNDKLTELKLLIGTPIDNKLTELKTTQYKNNNNETSFKSQNLKHNINVSNQNKTIEEAIISQKEKIQQSPILKKLIDENIQCFYHFTDIKNLKNICQNGLFSREYLENNDISSKLGGNMDSRNLDARKKLLNYIRLSFCSDHPMSYRLHQNGYQLVLLKISIDIVDKIPVLFSNINATDNNVVIKKTLEHIDFSSVKRTYVKKIDPDFKTHQAEILVLNHIPAQYILNLDNPQPMYDTTIDDLNEIYANKF